MPDYGHAIEFGYFLIPDARDPEGVLETARLADRLGYDLLAPSRTIPTSARTSTRSRCSA